MTDVATPQAPCSAPLTDEEFRDLGKAVGTLIHRVMRLRQDSDQGTVTVLSMLAKCGPVRASDLAHDLTLDLSTVSRHVQALERTGYIEKVPDPTDRRAMTLHVTAEGKDHVEQLWERRILQMREGLENWDPAELRTLSRLLGRYADDFQALIGRGEEDKTDRHDRSHDRSHGSGHGSGHD